MEDDTQYEEPLSRTEREEQNEEFIDQLVLDIANMLKRVCDVGALEHTITIPIVAGDRPHTIHIAVRRS